MRKSIDINFLQISKRQKKNLIRGKFICEKETKSSLKECGERCGTSNNNDNYKYIKGSSHIKYKSRFSYKVNANINCKRQNLMYCIICPTYKESYISQEYLLFSTCKTSQQTYTTERTTENPTEDIFGCIYGRKIQNHSLLQKTAKND